MPIGSYTHRLTRNPVKRALRLTFGTSDLHSHLRLRPMLDYVESLSTLRTLGRIRVLELGCGCGINLFELAERLPNLEGLGYDLNYDAIASATEVAARLFPGRVSFHHADACREDPVGEFDIVLLIDILEHVSDPKGLMRRVSKYVRVGGEVLVSVPTPRYPRVFGQEFHKAVGHLVEGYDLTTLNALAPKDLRLVQYRYSTGFFASAPCALFYRVLRRLPNSTLISLLRLCTLPFTAVDFLNGPRHSCSLFVAYQKV
jgi:2-polyprenyl-3-methyl-5-hydroxy-6-metoxy-1,4-benzoquinol methylase